MNGIDFLRLTLMISVFILLLILVFALIYLCYEFCSEKSRPNSGKYSPKPHDFIANTKWFSRPIEDPLPPKPKPIDETDVKLPEEKFELISQNTEKPKFEPKTEIKILEKNIFEKSFELIEKSYSDSQYSGIKNSYSNAYNSSPNGQIDWHRIYLDLMAIGNGYTAAIRRTGRLLAIINAEEKQEIYSSVEKLIELKKNYDKRSDDSNIYNNTTEEIKAWTRFLSL